MADEFDELPRLGGLERAICRGFLQGLRAVQAGQIKEFKELSSARPSASRENLRAPQSHEIQGVNLVAFGGQRERRHVHRHARIAGKHRQPADMRELMNHHAARNERPVAPRGRVPPTGRNCR